jgi:hypothetical protein
MITELLDTITSSVSLPLYLQSNPEEGQEGRGDDVSKLHRMVSRQTKATLKSGARCQ